MTKRVFYKTTITFEVLHEEPIPDDMLLDEVYSETVEGSYSGKETWNTEHIDGAACAKALIEQGSEPSFFRLTAVGEDEE